LFVDMSCRMKNALRAQRHLLVTRLPRESDAFLNQPRLAGRLKACPCTSRACGAVGAAMLRPYKRLGGWHQDSRRRESQIESRMQKVLRRETISRSRSRRDGGVGWAH
jgi:hypothetical protein